MLFSSLLYLCFFLPIVIVLHGVLPVRMRNGFLLLASVFFYAWGEISYVSLIAMTAVANWLFGLAMHKSEGGKRRLLLILALIMDIGLLAYYKYAGFLLGIVGLQAFAPQVVLPLGISFYTFQTMGYIIDVYRKKIPAERNLLDYSTFVLLFPQLIAGPIVNYVDIAVELKKRTLTAEHMEAGMKTFIKGLACKVLLANQLGLLWERAQGAGFDTLSAPAAWLCIIAFGLQIYFDFAGYSLMAIGIGKIFGFKFPMNFNHPYAAVSITDFWRRWHMTLSGWFRNYVYIPLGGNRKGVARGIVNMFVVWSLTGLWHGPSWNFVLWGVYFFVWLTLERTVLKNWLARAGGIRNVYALLVVLIGWVLFTFEDLGQGTEYLQRMFSLRFSVDVLYFLRNNIVLLVLAVAACIPPAARKITQWMSYSRITASITYGGLLLLSIACLIGDTYNPFIYFRF